MRKDKDMFWKTLDSKNIISRPWLNVRRDRVQLPDGRIHDEYYVLHYPDWVNVIAITEDGRMLLERQYRHAIGKVSTEIVAGCMEPGETPLDAAKRELKEETGFSGGTWTPFMKLSPNASTMDNSCYCFLAEGVKRTTTTHLDATEDIEVMLCSKQEVFKMLQHGEFCQALMVAPLWKYFSLSPSQT
jgi:ADP-ribose pyrophosphatase